MERNLVLNSRFGMDFDFFFFYFIPSFLSYLSVQWNPFIDLGCRKSGESFVILNLGLKVFRRKNPMNGFQWINRFVSQNNLIKLNHWLNVLEKSWKSSKWIFQSPNVSIRFKKGILEFLIVFHQLKLLVELV